MLLTDWIALVALMGTLGAQLLLRSFWVRYVKLMLPVAAVFIFGVLIAWSSFQYVLWKADPLSRTLLPPYTSINYYLGYVGIRLFSYWFIALAAALLIPALSRFLNRRFGERFFYPEEIPLMQIGIFLTGYPGFLFYVPSVLFIGTLLSVWYAARGKGRAPFYYLWLPVAIFVIILRIWFIPPEVLGQFAL